MDAFSENNNYTLTVFNMVSVSLSCLGYFFGFVFAVCLFWSPSLLLKLHLNGLMIFGCLLTLKSKALKLCLEALSTWMGLLDVGFRVR